MGALCLQAAPAQCCSQLVLWALGQDSLQVELQQGRWQALLSSRSCTIHLTKAEGAGVGVACFDCCSLWAASVAGRACCVPPADTPHSTIGQCTSHAVLE